MKRERNSIANDHEEVLVLDWSNAHIAQHVCDLMKLLSKNLDRNVNLREYQVIHVTGNRMLAHATPLGHSISGLEDLFLLETICRRRQMKAKGFSEIEIMQFFIQTCCAVKRIQTVMQDSACFYVEGKGAARVVLRCHPQHFFVTRSGVIQWDCLAALFEADLDSPCPEPVEMESQSWLVSVASLKDLLLLLMSVPSGDAVHVRPDLLMKCQSRYSNGMHDFLTNLDSVPDSPNSMQDILRLPHAQLHMQRLLFKSGASLEADKHMATLLRARLFNCQSATSHDSCITDSKPDRDTIADEAKDEKFLRLHSGGQSKAAASVVQARPVARESRQEPLAPRAMSGWLGWAEQSSSDSSDEEPGQLLSSCNFIESHSTTNSLATEDDLTCPLTKDDEFMEAWSQSRELLFDWAGLHVTSALLCE